MAKTTQEFLRNGEETAKLNAERQKNDVAPPEAAKVHPFVPDEGADPAVPELTAEPENPMQHDVNKPGAPAWELNRAPSAQ